MSTPAEVLRAALDDSDTDMRCSDEWVAQLAAAVLAARPGPKCGLTVKLGIGPVLTCVEDADHGLLHQDASGATFVELDPDGEVERGRVSGARIVAQLASLARRGGDVDVAAGVATVAEDLADTERRARYVRGQLAGAREALAQLEETSRG